MSVLRIQTVDIFRLKSSLPHPFHWASGTAYARQANLVRIRTESGVEGWGESLYDTAPILAQFAARLVGKDITEKQSIYGMLDDIPAMSDPITTEAAGAVDVALWDVWARAAGLPLCQFMSGKQPQAIDAYASSIYYAENSNDPVAEAVAWADLGFTGIKIKVGRLPLAQDIRRVQAVRNALGPGIQLMVDANQSCNAVSAIALAKALQPFDLMWLEEPVAARDLDAHRALKNRSDLPVAAGESLHAWQDFQPLLADRLLDVVQFNLSRVGGFDTAMQIVHAAEDTPIAIHHWGTPLGLAASLHLACCLPASSQVIMEIDRSPNPLRAITEWPEDSLSHGRIAPPPGPGLGITPDPGILTQYSVG